MRRFSHPVLIVNPRSGEGKGARWFRAVKDRFLEVLPGLEVHYTAYPLHASEVSVQAAKEGADLLLVLGGDGTLNEVVCGLLSLPFDERPVLLTLPGGTGGDFRRLFGLRRDLDLVKEVIAQGLIEEVDAGLLEFEDHSGNKRTRHFINIASFGISGLVDRYVNSTTKVFGGRFSFIVGTLRGMLRYRNQRMLVTVDGKVFYDGLAALVTAANGRFFGSGMMIAPYASLQDGLLDVVILGDLTKLKFLGLGRFIYSGAHLKHEGVKWTRGKRVKVEAEGEVLIDLDGEQVGRLPVLATVISGAIRVLVPGPSSRCSILEGVLKS